MGEYYRRSFKYNPKVVKANNPELRIPDDRWAVDRKMLIEDASQGMAERKRLSQKVMQYRSGNKRPMMGMFDNQPHDPRETFKGSLAQRMVMIGKIPMGKAVLSNTAMKSYWSMKQQSNPLDVAVKRQALNNELVPNYPLDQKSRIKVLTIKEKEPPMKYFTMKNTDTNLKQKKKRRTADQDIMNQEVAQTGKTRHQTKELKNNKREEVNNNSKQLKEPDELQRQSNLNVLQDSFENVLSWYEGRNKGTLV